MRALALLLLLILPRPAAAQVGVRGTAAIVPDSFAVGDVVLAAVRVRVPAGVRVEFPDTLSISGDYEGAGAPVLRSDTVDGAIEVTAGYPVTAWRPGPMQLPDTPVRLITEQGIDTLLVSFGEARVASVLPADTAGIAPRPAKDVLGANRVWWPLLVGLLVAAALAALAFAYWRRRRKRPVPVPVVATIPPRIAALALLDRVRGEHMIENGELKRAYTVIAEALRMYLEANDGAWGTDLTTTEISVLLSLRQIDAWEALDVLTRADLVKFARAVLPAATAFEDVDRARGWITHFGPAEPETEPAEAA